VVSDNGTPAGQGAYQQGDPGMGDIRIGAYNFGNSYLACTYLPGANNYSIAGDINFNTGQTFNVGSTYDLQTVALHEFGHALGLGHSSLSTTVMYAYYTGLKKALTSTDINNVQANYGARLPDAYAGNTSFAAAASLNTQINPLSLTAVANNLSINSTTQAEYFTFTAPWGSSNTLTVTAQSTGLSMFTPSLTVYAANQSTVLGSATSAVKYHGVTASTSISGITAGQQFYVKVSGVDSSAFSTGAFALTLNFGTGPAPAVTLPNTLTLNGTVLIGGGGLALTVGQSDNNTKDYMSPSLDIVPPCCAGHGGGCGCPACAAAAVAAAEATDASAKQKGSGPLWEEHAGNNKSASTLGSSTLHARNESDVALADDATDLALWRDATDAWFGQEALSDVE
jgi:Matrixin